MSFDPKLKRAAKEIKDVLAKHDLCGEVLIASETHLEYVHWFGGSWSGLSIVDGVGVRFKLKAKTGDDAERLKADRTIGFIVRMRDVLAETFSLYDRLYGQARKHFLIGLSEGEHTPHRPEMEEQ